MLQPAGTNASGLFGTLGDVELRLSGSIVPVPEPGTYALMLGGLALLLAVARKRCVRLHAPIGS